MTERERQVMKKLKEVVDKQRDEIRAKDRELTLKNEDIEAVRRQAQHLSRSKAVTFNVDTFSTPSCHIDYLTISCS